MPVIARAWLRHWRIYCNLLPFSLCTNFQTGIHMHNYDTRFSYRHSSQLARLKMKQLSNNCLSPALWNALPRVITKLSSIGSFKCSAKDSPNLIHTVRHANLVTYYKILCLWPFSFCFIVRGPFNFDLLWILIVCLLVFVYWVTHGSGRIYMYLSLLVCSLQTAGRLPTLLWFICSLLLKLVF